MADFLSSLNPEQRIAVEQTEGPLLILAGAGSGKTRVIAHRIAYLIAEKGAAPWNILAVTFTNKAAQEMRQRVQRLLHGQELPALPLVSTFHSLCVRILRQDIEKLNDRYTRTFTIYDQDDSLRLIKNCIKDLGYDEKQLGLRGTQSTISSAKNRGEDVAAFAARADYVDERRAAIARVYEAYEVRLHANNALDFDDLMIKAVRLLRDVPEVREKYNNKFRYILVDEYQDTNSLQFSLISLLTEKQQNICVVGDEDQSIYKWRGADITNILNFEHHFPRTKTIRLEQNYRSTQTILDVAGAVVKHNIERKGKNLWTSNPHGDRVRYFQAFDAESEARFVAGKILEHRQDEWDLRSAVLYRTNSQSRVFEEAMRRAGLQYNIVGGFSFYERLEVRDIIAYLKLALNPDDSIALQRVINSPTRGIGKHTLAELTRRTMGEVQRPVSKVQSPGDFGTAGASPAMSAEREPTPKALDNLAQGKRAARHPGRDDKDFLASPRSGRQINNEGPGVSLWQAVELVIKDPQGMSMRAVSNLRGFRRIIIKLSEMAGEVQSPTSKVQSQTIRASQDEVRTPTSRGSDWVNDDNESPSVAGHRSSVASVSDIVKAAILETGYENALKSEKTDEAEARLENLQELVNAAVDYDEQGIEGLREFIDHSALVSDTDQYKDDAPVTLMTAHSAKGLEFPLVFIVGLEDGLLPHSRSATDPAELEEERRLCYVAITRAERYLYVTHAMKRRVYGEEIASEPSQFLNEMPLELMEDLSRGNSWLSFARGSGATDDEVRTPTSRGSDRVQASEEASRKKRGAYTGKTYDSVDSIAEFFKQRATQLGNTGGSFQRRVQSPKSKVQSRKPETGSSPVPRPPSPVGDGAADFVPGSYVRHAKYGRGLVLRREGVGDSLKLTVTFPGYGQKKLIEKYAGLERA